ncbi:hypothetical protein D8895_00370 [Streptococcus sp. BCA20]|uniref:Uncharacterized protein n=1 Tax=Streptococcus oralis TaxID=1303 RepID=A0A3R9N3V4_STROR|nr:hypothetical protein D8893_06300 [Streptococcus oralis]RSJ38648.1 hypothetical protein D8895_00370 [Streptococcus sp. BCA20]VEF79023.1 Uncharacterised protein [Streptococcus oralis ATCC 35037]RSI48292.1 hypothetical protein D8868_06530 [Streptococcus oralis]RSI75197.1 hypothetical protein D8858_06580 [Streptococcus oralis]
MIVTYYKLCKATIAKKRKTNSFIFRFLFI